MTASCRQCVRARVRACEHACVLLSVSWRDAISVPAVVVSCMIVCFFGSFLGGPFGGPNPATKVRSLTVSERTFGAKFGPCSGPLFLTAFGCCLVPRGAARDRSRKQCLLEKKTRNSPRQGLGNYRCSCGHIWTASILHGTYHAVEPVATAYTLPHATGGRKAICSFWLESPGRCRKNVTLPPWKCRGQLHPTLIPMAVSSAVCS